ncbi:glycosyltransferase family 2 protein [uncultured Paraglaciecola sp.]|uniref:glycosyltransferase family 2 protein n=1 Tax=uncultured Paraglaciecola sp. TaxID=1765024 RepID=UPI00262B920C|nr:glycosyltransferase family 2 protein [uncultured Paraglaciecola sp.]
MMEKTMTKTSVIIPYFQKKAGTLLNALNSISNQTALKRIQEVIIVDDGSPIPAESELQGISSTLVDKIKVFRVPNGGVSKARNYALDRVSEESEYVSFLDSDDVWLKNHIFHSLQALDSGSDFHFCNFTQLNQDVGAFERAGRVDPNEHKAIENTESLLYQGNMLSQIALANIIGTSTVSFRFKKFSQLRFDETYSYAGEDYHMWLSLCCDASNISFTAFITCTYGAGVNIFSGAEWGTKHLGMRLLDEVKYREQILEQYSLDLADQNTLCQQISNKKKDFQKNMWSMLKHLQIIDVLTLLKSKRASSL